LSTGDTSAQFVNPITAVWATKNHCWPKGRRAQAGAGLPLAASYLEIGLTFALASAYLGNRRDGA
jgi:hypothetical protein